MLLIESQSFTDQSIYPFKIITFTASPQNYGLVNLRVWLYDLAAVSAAKTASGYITRAGSGVESRFVINPTITTTAASICLSSDLFTLAAGDVLKIVLVGSSSDTGGVDIVAELWGVPDLSAQISALTAALAVVDDFLDTEIAAIKAKTDNLPTDPADESLLEAYISTETSGLATSAALGMVSSVVNTLPTAAEIDTQLSATHGAGTWGNSTGGGAVSTTVTVTVSGLARDGVEVWVTTDAAGSNLVASGVTDALGEVDFMLDVGTYYVWKQLSGVNFTNPQTMVVS